KKHFTAHHEYTICTQYLSTQCATTSTSNTNQATKTTKTTKTTSDIKPDTNLIVNSYQMTDNEYGPTKQQLNTKPQLKRDISTLDLYEKSNETRLKKFKINDDDSNKLNSVSEAAHKPQKFARKNLLGHNSCVNKVEWSSTNLLLSASMDKSMKIWDPFQEKLLATLNVHEGAVRDASWNAEGTRVLSGSYDKNALISDVRSETVVSRFIHENFVTAVKWKPEDGNVFLTGSQKVVNAWDLRSDAKPVRIYPFKHGQVLDLAFLQDGSEFLCSSDFVAHDSADKTIIAWDFKSSAMLSNQIYNERFTCPHLVVHPKGNKFVAQSNGDYIAEFSTSRPYKMNRKKRFEGHKVSGYNIGCDFNSDGRYLYSGSSDGILFCYEFRNGCLRKRIPVFGREAVLSVACHPVWSFTLAVSSWNGKVQILCNNYDQ
uniref:Uncharacterized protein n=1 Tax=Strigamia maritima TaxID=126957 RepID=T1JIM7_STRMM